MSSFWDKVEKCKHKNISPDYSPLVYCEGGVEFCYADEEHCLDCGVYISKCGCGCSNGMSGWSGRRWSNYCKRKEKERGQIG